MHTGRHTRTQAHTPGSLTAAAVFRTSLVREELPSAGSALAGHHPPNHPNRLTHTHTHTHTQTHSHSHTHTHTDTLTHSAWRCDIPPGFSRMNKLNGLSGLSCPLLFGGGTAGSDASRQTQVLQASDNRTYKNRK